MKTLQQWEQRLRPFFGSSLRIIGEIPLTYQDVEDMAGLVKTLLAQHGLNRATFNLITDYPHTFITLMSAFAAFNEQKNFWDAFAKFIGTEHQNLSNYGWRHQYVEIAEKFGLKVFDFSDDSTPYVTTIRFQGGIPAYSLPDYFEYMVLPAVEREGLRELKPEKALEYLINHIYSVDSPVLDFLKNSGELGIDFFSESCKLARHAITHHNEILPIDEIDLPPYVVAAFADFLDRKEDEQQHWRKPELLAAPYSEDSAVFLHFPEQEINLDLFTRRIFWRVEWDGQNSVFEIPCMVFRQRENIVTKESFQPIEEKVSSLSISIYAITEDSNEEQELRRWNLPLLPPLGKTPLVAFNSTGRMVPTTTGLPAEALYLLIPAKSELKVEGTAHAIEELIPLIGTWRDWKMERWDLTNAWSLLLYEAESPLGPAIPILGSIPQPELSGGHLFQYQDQTDLPLYTSELPFLKLPVSQIYGKGGELVGWQIRIHSLWESTPNIDHTFKLSQFHHKIQIDANWAIFPLSVLLGEKVAGKYQINLYGPRDMRAEFRFRAWPKIMVLGLDQKLRQPAKKPIPSQFILRLQDGAECEIQPGMEVVEIQKTPAGWEIIAPPELNRVLLNLTTTNEHGESVRVPVTIPLAKLRWGLATEQSLGDLNLGQTVIYRSIDELQQAGAAALHVEMYGLGELFYSIKLRLIEIGETETIIQEAKFTRTDFTKDWLRVGLGQFNDSIRRINSLGQFELAYFPIGSANEPIRIPLLELTRELNVQNVKFEQIEETTWKIIWHEEQPLNNRRVLIMSAWQPWQQPWEYKIPDQVRGEFSIKEISIPPARYLLYFYIKPTWVGPMTSAPEKLNPVLIDLCSPQDRIQAINSGGESPNEKFKCLIEKAVIFESLGNITKSGELLSEGAIQLNSLTNLNILLGSLKWIQKHEIDPPAVKSYFLKSMFNKKIVESILARYEVSDPLVTEYLGFTGKVKNVIPAESAKILLDHIDEPAVIYSCLHNLLIRKDNDLPIIIIKMMKQARLSKRDALNLLGEDPVWAIEKISNLESNQYVDKLIAGLLPKVAQKDEFKEDARIYDWMVRALPYENNEPIAVTYIRQIFTIGHPNRFGILMKAFSDQKINEAEVKEIFSLDPKSSIAFLQASSNNSDNQLWVDWLIETHPGAAGIIKAGAILKTPFGEGKVEVIEKIHLGKIKQVLLGDPSSSLTLLIDAYSEEYRIIIDFNVMLISVFKETEIWKCKFCDFMHPIQRIVMKHSNAVHHKWALNHVSLPYTFTLDQLEIL